MQATIEELLEVVFSVGSAPGSDTCTVVLQVVEGDKKGTQYLGI
jgi:hypothetical protein